MVILAPPQFEEKIERLIALANYRQTVGTAREYASVSADIRRIADELKEMYSQVHEEWYAHKDWGNF
jgi:hypothetical protein